MGLEDNEADSDGDGTPNHQDDDDDNDGIPTKDECHNGAPCPDSDGDGLPDSQESNTADTDNDGRPDAQDDDDDGDGILTKNECPNGQCPDSDGDGIPNHQDQDDDGDGIPTKDECPTGAACADSDGDGLNDGIDDDDDGDGIPTKEECPNGTCPDSDGDGTPDNVESNDLDSDGDGTPDVQDTDDDNDGVPTSVECPNGIPCPDSDGNGTPDYLDANVAPVDPTVEQTINPPANSDEPTVQITAPAGATEEPFVLGHTSKSITASTHAPPAGYSRVHGFNLDAFIKGVLQSGFVFSRPLTMTINYTDQQVAQFVQSTLHVRYWDVSEQTWKPDGIVIVSRDPDKNQITITIAHLTEFGVFGELNAKGSTIYLPMMVKGN